MWRPTDWLTSESVCSVLSLMPAPSLARPFVVWYCFTTGKMFCQRLWIPEPSWNTQWMFPYVWNELLLSAVTQILMFNITRYYTLHSCHSHGTLWSYIMTSSANSKRCEHSGDFSADGSNPQRSSSHLSGIQLQPRHQSELSMSEMNKMKLCIRPNNGGTGSIVVTHSRHCKYLPPFFFPLFFFLLRLV